MFILDCRVYAHNLANGPRTRVCVGRRMDSSDSFYHSSEKLLRQGYQTRADTLLVALSVTREVAWRNGTLVPRVETHLVMYDCTRQFEHEGNDVRQS